MAAEENILQPFNKLSELNKRVSTETAAHWCSVCICFKKPEAAVSRCSSK